VEYLDAPPGLYIVELFYLIDAEDRFQGNTDAAAFNSKIQVITAAPSR